MAMAVDDDTRVGTQVGEVVVAQRGRWWSLAAAGFVLSGGSTLEGRLGGGGWRQDSLSNACFLAVYVEEDERLHRWITEQR